MIFKNFERTDSQYKKRGVSSFDFLDNSSWPICEFARNFINEHGAAFENDREFISRLTSVNDRHHSSATFELLISCIFKNLGFKIIKHPTSQYQDGGIPDFQFKKENLQIIAECTLAGSTFENMEIENRKDAVIAIIDEIENFPYWIHISFSSVSDASISKKQLLKYFIEKKAELDIIPPNNLFNYIFTFENEGWHLEFRFHKKSNLDIKRTLGSISGGVYSENLKPLSNALDKKKPAKYNIGNSPYFVCLNTSETFNSEESIEKALFGQNYYGCFDLLRQDVSGFFFRDGAPINTSVTGVLLFKGLSLLTLNATDVCLWVNPFAKEYFKFTEIKIPQKQYEIKDNQLHVNELHTEVSIFDLLQVDKMKYDVYKKS